MITKERTKSKMGDIIALASTGSVAGIAVTKLTGHSKMMGAITGIGLSLLFYSILKLANQ